MQRDSKLLQAVPANLQIDYLNSQLKVVLLFSQLSAPLVFASLSCPYDNETASLAGQLWHCDTCRDFWR